MNIYEGYVRLQGTHCLRAIHPSPCLSLACPVLSPASHQTHQEAGAGC